MTTGRVERQVVNSLFCPADLAREAAFSASRNDDKYGRCWGSSLSLALRQRPSQTLYHLPATGTPVLDCKIIDRVHDGFLVREEDSDGRSEFKHKRFGQFAVNDAYLDAIHGAVEQRDLSSQSYLRSMPFSRLQPGQTPPSSGVWCHDDSLSCIKDTESSCLYSSTVSNPSIRLLHIRTWDQQSFLLGCNHRDDSSPRQAIYIYVPSALGWLG